ncbi:AAA family ATPase [Pseudocolwellia sp. HL-MZ7]|uniref:AAA family ATPase n=1 Tax=Pseudocolwellia sp. HL-MZ7 TaxID=3400627 RepID=UPI003CF2F04D
MKIKKVEIEAFRAYKTKTDGTFDFINHGEEPANFVAIYAPNGFGKSSFYDAVEWAITNRVKRLESYQHEVKSTKNPDEGLKILRNKYVEGNTSTTVVLSTNNQNVYERQLPNIRKNQNDMSLGKSENEFFRRAILSQDEIEGFLREEKPQERYSKFMESFGGNIETARKELTALINDNSTELSTLKKKCETLQAELKQPIDISIFERFNSVATELNSLGESIVLPDEAISPQGVHQLNDSLVSRQHELNKTINDNNKILELLTERLSQIPEIKLQVDNEAEKKLRLVFLLKCISDAAHYKELFDSHEKSVEDQKLANVRLKHLIELAESTDHFLKTESRFKEIAKNQKDLTEECSKLSSELAGIQKNLEVVTEELKKDDDRTLLLKKSKASSDLVYAELSSNKAQYDVLGQEVTNKQTEIQKYKIRQEKLNTELSELSELKLTATSLLAGNGGTSFFEQEKIVRLAKCHAEVDLLKLHENTLQATQKSLVEQMDLHTKLTSMGLNYLSIEPSDTCPLCTKKHLSSDELINKVKSQSLESELSRENSNKIIESTLRQKELNNEIQGITKQALEAQGHKLFSLRNELSEVNIKLTKVEQEKAAFEYELKKLENRNAELTQSVWGLSKQELLTRTEAELSQLFEKRLSLINQQNDLVAKIQGTTKSLESKSVKQSQLVSEMTSKSSDHVYVSVLAYLNENSIAVQDIKSHFAEKQSELESSLQEYIASCKSLVGQCHDLQQKMIADGTWVDVSYLNKEKESLEVALANSQAAVNGFYGSISNLISIRSEEPIEQVQALIKTKAEECRVNTEVLEKMLNSIKLLLDLIISFKPFMKHISTQKELETLTLKLAERKQLDEVLGKERAIIIEKLDVLIDSFFFEDLINSIYKKINPHPIFKKVEFKVSFDTDKPSLNILVSDEAGGMISPILFFSAAQTNILSLSVFLANALHAKDDNKKSIDVILIDDPIQSMDSINVLSTIDLLRSICLKFDKQIIISTHDENFFGLLQRKIPTEIFGSKFLQLEKFGVVSPVEPILN